jgi:protein pelota
MATDPTKSADLAACVMQEGLAHVCLVTNSLTLVRAKIDINMPRKRRGNTQQHEKALHRFYEVNFLVVFILNHTIRKPIQPNILDT